MSKTSKRFFSILSAIALAITLLSASTVPVIAGGGNDSQNAYVNVGPRANTADDPAGGIYVSPSGNDQTATGTFNAPYRSINTALESASPGATIILRSGTYREGMNVRVRTPNITIKSAKGEWAIIDLTTYDSGNDEDSGVYFDVDSSGGKLQGVEVIGGFYAVCMETKWDWGDPSDRAGASNIVIEDCILHDSKRDVIKIKPNCNNITIQYNEIYNSGQTFAGRPQNGEDNAEGIDNVNGDNMIVRNNYIHDICSNAVYAKGGATDVLVENNRIERAHGAGIMVGFDTSPEFFDLSSNSQYYENIRGIVRNNLIIDTGWEGIGLYGSKDAQVYNNTIVNAVTNRDYHSAIYFGLTYQDWEDYAGRPANSNPTIRNNVVSQPAGYDFPMIEIRYADELGGMSALDGSPVMSNNCYYIAGRSATFYDHRPRNILEDAGFSAWQAHIGSDTGSVEVNPALDDDYIATNPQCDGMGIQYALVVTDIETTLPEQPNAGTGTPSMGNFNIIRTYTAGLLTDVDEDMWYGNNNQRAIARAYEYGLMNGYDGNVFLPNGNMLVAEAITVAARIHSRYSTGSESFSDTNPWYQTYVDYASSHGIIQANEFSNYDRAATRGEVAYIFSNALPADELEEQNEVNSLPDVSQNTPYYSYIFLLYRAGVLTGNDDSGTFTPNSNISRAEVSAIISRIILPNTRVAGNAYG